MNLSSFYAYEDAEREILSIFAAVKVQLIQIASRLDRLQGLAAEDVASGKFSPLEEQMLRNIVDSANAAAHTFDQAWDVRENYLGLVKLNMDRLREHIFETNPA